MKSNHFILLTLLSLSLVALRGDEEKLMNDELKDDFEMINEVADAKANAGKKEILNASKHALVENLDDDQLELIQKLSKFAQNNDAEDLMDTIEAFMTKLDDRERKELLEIFEMQEASEIITKRSEKKEKHQKGKEHKGGRGKGHKKGKGHHKKEYDDFFARIQAAKAGLRKHNKHLESMLNNYEKRSLKNSDASGEKKKTKQKKHKKHGKHGKGVSKDDKVAKRSTAYSDDEFDKYMARIKAAKARFAKQNEELQEIMSEEDKRSAITDFDDEESFERYWKSLSSEEQEKLIKENGEEDEVYYDAKESKRSMPEEEEDILDDYLAKYSNDRLAELKEQLDEDITKRSHEETHDPEEHEREVKETEEFLDDLPLQDLEDVEMSSAMEVDPSAFFAVQPEIWKRSEELSDESLMVNLEDADGEDLRMVVQEEDDQLEKRFSEDDEDDDDYKKRSGYTEEDEDDDEFDKRSEGRQFIDLEEEYRKRSEDDFDSLNERIDKMRSRVQNRYKNHRFQDFDEE